ncbi:MAG: kelch repeat-containing protein, partial [Kiritimatiellae bacterium]|nr:kelch repeat-containing protein [Kiritimatiellia bacterium]
MRKILQGVAGLGLIAVLAVGGAAGAESLLVAKVSTARPNTWVKIHESETGGRNSPIFFYEPSLKKFVLTGGTPGGNYANARRHFETEMFDPETCTWINAYPPSAPYKNVTGETDAPAISSDGLKSLLVQDKAGVWRVAMFGSAYGTDSRAHFQWAYDTDSKKLYAYLWSRTLVYEPLKREWGDTGAEPFSKGQYMVWGNMCYDPVNREILSIGGSSAERGGTPGTHVFRIAENRWEKVISGSQELRKLSREATELRRQAWALLSACRNRYFVVESAREKEARLSERASAIEASLRILLGRLDSTKLTGHEKEAGRVAREKLTEARGMVQGLGSRLDAAISPALISEVKALHDTIERAELALAPEPPGRAHSQPTFDAGAGKIVLFGGNGLDRCYADTWLYDPKTRTWAQKWPSISPSPRAGHAVVYLPKSRKVALIGGYTIDGWFRPIPHQIWLYDVEKDEWKPFLSVPLGPRDTPAPNTPAGGVGGNYAGGGS